MSKLDRSKIDTELLLDYLNLFKGNDIYYIDSIVQNRFTMNVESFILISCTLRNINGIIETNRTKEFYFKDDEYLAWLNKIERNKKINGLLK